ncbi:MAG TPA: class I SAM-dependent methyltransferase [Bryobacteraceae bacterium]|jgi:ubiquinone/menaquinone biosynthesis C-methylase UbiE
MDSTLIQSAPSSKAYKGLGMEGLTAKWYASLTRKSMQDFKALAKRVDETLPPGARVLEVAPGPGYFAIELAKLGTRRREGYRIKGLDISRTFVEIAQRNAMEAQVRVDFRQGNAADMPFEDSSFDFVLCRAAFKNFTEPLRALQEMHRVLKGGGRAMIIDLRRDASMESINRAVSEMHVGPVNGFMTRFTFRFVLLKRAYSKQDFERLLDQTKFGPAEIREDLIGLELTLHKTADSSGSFQPA